LKTDNSDISEDQRLLAFSRTKHRKATMADSVISRSPIHEALDARGAEWRCVNGIDFAVRIYDEETERGAMGSLGLCDVSGLRKLGLKGCDAQSWLVGEGIDVPGAVFDSRPLESDGIIIRFGSDEFFLEEGIAGSTVSSLAEQMDSHDGRLFRVEHQEATLLLTGSRSIEVLAQTCGINFAEVTQRRVIFTRIAGVSCGLLPDAVRDIPACRIWVDPSYAVYLWETLAEICESLGGKVIGVGCVYPELLS
jgi:glycine cleavage system aminomethyltransferase T